MRSQPNDCNRIRTYAEILQFSPTERNGVRPSEMSQCKSTDSLCRDCETKDPCNKIVDASLNAWCTKLHSELTRSAQHARTNIRLNRKNTSNIPEIAKIALNHLRNSPYLPVKNDKDNKFSSIYRTDDEKIRNKIVESEIYEPLVLGHFESYFNGLKKQYFRIAKQIAKVEECEHIRIKINSTMNDRASK